MKTQEELNELAKEYKSLVSKLKELTEEELLMITGGFNLNSIEIDEIIKPTNTQGWFGVEEQ